MHAGSPDLRANEEYQQKRHRNDRDKTDCEAKKRPIEELLHCLEYTTHKAAAADATASILSKRVTIFRQQTVRGRHHMDEYLVPILL